LPKNLEIDEVIMLGQVAVKETQHDLDVDKSRL
jgi:hypothetical protein